MANDTDSTEFIPDQLTLVSRLDQLTNGLNELRNQIQGRGVSPIGSAALASEVNNAQEHWHDVRNSLLADDGAQLKDHPYDSSEVLEKWERLVNGIVDKAIAENVPGVDVSAKLNVTHTVQNPGEAITEAEHKLSTGATVLKDLLILGLGLAGTYLLAKSGVFDRKRGSA